MSIGSTILHCRANLASPTVRVGDAHWLSMDGTIFVQEENDEENEIHCHFTYCREDTKQIVTAGKYEIMAMVSNTTRFFINDTFPTDAMQPQVIGIREHANCTLFQLRGDIFSVSMLQPSLYTCKYYFPSSCSLFALTLPLIPAPDSSTAAVSIAWTETTCLSKYSHSNGLKVAQSTTSLP